MKFALVNPPWSFVGSAYFGCRQPHLPLEFGYAKALLEAEGHEVRLIDGQLFDLTLNDIEWQIADFRPNFTVITTAPSYLFWRCAPPELRVPQETAEAVRLRGGRLVVVGPHASTTPATTQRKLGADIVIRGECEQVLPRLASGTWTPGDSPAASDMAQLPALRWPDEFIRAHHHHHHRFDTIPATPGAEMEVSRGCPYHCSFCAKDNFRTNYRRRPLPVILEELDGLIAQGVTYVYFIDEIFLPWRELLTALAGRHVQFGIQTRIDLWSPEMLQLLGSAGCVSIEAGVESITETGRNLLDKQCRLTTDELAARLIDAKRHVPFVQANLIEMRSDAPAAVQSFRQTLIDKGVWANQPVPLFPYPGSPDYAKLWGAPDDRAWERAMEYYLRQYDRFSDIQEERPLPLADLEWAAPHSH